MSIFWEGYAVVSFFHDNFLIVFASSKEDVFFVVWFINHGIKWSDIHFFYSIYNIVDIQMMVVGFETVDIKFFGIKAGQGEEDAFFKVYSFVWFWEFSLH